MKEPHGLPREFFAFLYNFYNKKYIKYLYIISAYL